MCTWKIIGSPMTRERIYSRYGADWCESLRTRNSRQLVYRHVPNRRGRGAWSGLILPPPPKNSELVPRRRTRRLSESHPTVNAAVSRRDGRQSGTGRVRTVFRATRRRRVNGGNAPSLRRNRGRPWFDRRRTPVRTTDPAAETCTPAVLDLS